MTLIAGFRCGDGGVTCADTQETVGGHRVTRQKLEPFTAGNFEVGVAGSGEDGDLIDAVVQRFRDSLTADNVSNLAELKTFFHRELLDFNKQEASIVPKKYRRMKFLITARSMNPPAWEMWETSSSRLIRVDTWSLIGWDEEIYKRSINRLYSPALSMQQAISLGMFVMALAEDTSNYVRGPITVVVVRDRTMRVEDAGVVKEFKEKTELFTQQLESMLLACADTSLGKSQFEQHFLEFQETVRQLRSD